MWAVYSAFSKGSAVSMKLGSYVGIAGIMIGTVDTKNPA